MLFCANQRYLKVPMQLHLCFCCCLHVKQYVRPAASKTAFQERIQDAVKKKCTERRFIYTACPRLPVLHVGTTCNSASLCCRSLASAAGSPGLIPCCIHTSKSFSMVLENNKNTAAGYVSITWLMEAVTNNCTTSACHGHQGSLQQLQVAPDLLVMQV